MNNPLRPTHKNPSEPKTIQRIDITVRPVERIGMTASSRSAGDPFQQVMRRSVCSESIRFRQGGQECKARQGALFKETSCPCTQLRGRLWGHRQGAFCGWPAKTMRGNFLLVIGVCLAARSGLAQEPAPPDYLLRKPYLDKDIFSDFSSRPWHTSVQGQTPRLPLLGLPSGFLQEPIGLEEEDSHRENSPAGGSSRDDDLDGLVVAIGSYNPFFAWRHPSEPGQVGYHQFYSQARVLEMGRTRVCVCLEALTPAGLEA